MKKVEKEIQKIQKVITYISEDGLEFSSEENCKEWENSYKGTLCKAFNVIPHIETNGDSSYLRGGQEDDCVWVLKPRHFDDIKVINAYTKTFTGTSAALTQDDIGVLMMINFGCNNDWCDVYRVDNYLKKIQNTFNKFKETLEGQIDNRVEGQTENQMEN